MTHTIAAIDIGTNSFHLVVARVDDNGRVDVVAREKEAVRLGSGAGDMKELAADAVDRGIETLGRMRRIAEHAGAEAILGVATSAVREASNRATFVRRAANEAGLEVQVISGVEEARLIHLGVLQAVPVFDRRHLVVDIGGGSTEFVVGVGTSPDLLRSLKLGAIRLTDRFFPGGTVRPKAVRQCRSHIASYLTAVRDDIAERGFEVAVGSSGTIQTVARLTGGPTEIGARSVTAEQIAATAERLAGLRTTKDRLDIVGLETRRADIIVAGAILLDEIVQAMDIDRMEISEYALREGIVFEQIRRAQASGPDPFHRLGDLRRHSVMQLAERFQEDMGHAEHITDLALELFDDTAELHGADEDARDLLEAAALLHNVGLFINHSAHHRHSYYVIRNSEHLIGFTEREIEIIALIARYHRKSAPKPKHTEFAELNDRDQQLVRTLAGLLRIAIGLDRSNRQVVARAHASLTPSGSVRITATIGETADAEVEVFTARARADLLTAALGRDVEVEAVVAPMGRQAHPASR